MTRADTSENIFQQAGDSRLEINGIAYPLRGWIPRQPTSPDPREQVFGPRGAFVTFPSRSLPSIACA